MKNAPTLKSESHKDLEPLSHNFRSIMRGKSAHLVDLEEAEMEIEKEYALQKEKNARDLMEWRELMEESDISTEELREAIEDLNKTLKKKASEAQHTSVMALQTSPMKKAETFVPSIINLNQITSGPNHGLIELAGPSGTSDATERATVHSSTTPPLSYPATPREREMEGILDFQTLRKRMGHEIHPISMMMARCPPLNPETGLPYDVSQSPSSPSIVSMRSSPIPNHLDEYLSTSSANGHPQVEVEISSSSSSDISYRPTECKDMQTQTQISTEDVGTQVQISHPSISTQTENWGHTKQVLFANR